MHIPSKTFLMGEYLAMYGGPAILALTEPCFSIDGQKRLHPDCMAARLWREHTNTDCDWGLLDPYQGQGGMGASSAEFLLAYQQIFPPSHQSTTHLRDIFWQYVDDQAAHKPSGYDVMAQMQEGLVLIEGTNLQALTWSFDHLGFVLVHSGQKLKTHEHLSRGQWSLDVEHLTSLVRQAQQALIIQDEKVFVQSIQHFHQALFEADLLASHSKILLTKWMNELPIVAAKGCGAMGADVLLLVAKREDIPLITAYLTLNKHVILATHQQLYVK